MLYLSGIIISFFLSLVLMTKRNKSQADDILLAWLILLGFHLLTFYFFFTHQFRYPSLIALGLPLPLVHGPFLYLYTYLQTSSHRLKKLHWLHFLPPILSYTLFAKFFTLPRDQQAAVFTNHGHGFETQLTINVYAIYISGIVYVTLSLLRLFKYRKTLPDRFSNTERINFNWLLYLILWIMVIWIVVLFVQKDEFIYGAASLFVLWLGFFGIKQVQVFTYNESNPPEPVSQDHHPDTTDKFDAPSAEPQIPSEPATLKYQKSTLSEEDISEIHEKLQHFMAEQKPFKNPDLTLDELAKSLDVHPNYLSQVINSKENKTFYDLINEKRVDDFIKNITEPASQQYTLLAIAYESGFNSKASFNRNFKKYTGHTPSHYLKLQPVK
jgi:AraC-like DNA-binding protein